MIVHDFAYADLGFDGYKPPSILQVPGAKDVAVEIFSMSKSYNMAGWRVGFCLGNPKMIAALARIKSYLDYGVFQPIQIASIIALRECEEDTQEDLRAVSEAPRRAGERAESRRLAGGEAAGLDVPVGARCRSSFAPLGSLEFAKLLIEKALVAVSPGIGFGPMGEGHVRFALIENEQRHPAGLPRHRPVFEVVVTAPGREARSRRFGRKARLVAARLVAQLPDRHSRAPPARSPRP